MHVVGTATVSMSVSHCCRLVSCMHGAPLLFTARITCFETSCALLNLSFLWLLAIPGPNGAVPAADPHQPHYSWYHDGATAAAAAEPAGPTRSPLSPKRYRDMSAGDAAAAAVGGSTDGQQVKRRRAADFATPSTMQNRSGWLQLSYALMCLGNCEYLLHHMDVHRLHGTKGCRLSVLQRVVLQCSCLHRMVCELTSLST